MEACRAEHDWTRAAARGAQRQDQARSGTGVQIGTCWRMVFSSRPLLRWRSHQRGLATALDGPRQPAQQVNLAGPAHEPVDAASWHIAVVAKGQLQLPLISHGGEQVSGMEQLQGLLMTAPPRVPARSGR